jgi:hypothetical protein
VEREGGGEARVHLDRIEWPDARARAQPSLGLHWFLLLGSTALALAIAGAPAPLALAASLLLALTWHAGGGFAQIHLARYLARVAVFGLVVAAAARGCRSRSRPALDTLVYATLLLKGGLVFHPRYAFVDLPIHETLLNLLYHRGPFDFWSRLPDYQLAHNLGVAPVGGSYVAFPYAILFYLFAWLGNVLKPDPSFWLKLGGALAGALVLFPLGALARRLSNAAGADIAAGLSYLLIPALTRSLLLMEYSALLGHLFDLIALAYLTRVALSFSSRRRLLTGAAVVAASLVAYTAGFIHLGLLVGGSLFLAPLLGGLSRRDAIRFAVVGTVALAVALAAYHPRTVANLYRIAAGGGGIPPAAQEDGESILGALGRAGTLLGLPLLFAGTAGLAGMLRGPLPPALRLLAAAWLLSGLAAYALRFAVADLFHYGKELYWLGALLAVGQGLLMVRAWRSHRFGWAGSALLMGAAVAAAAVEMGKLLPRFYDRYLFL